MERYIKETVMNPSAELGRLADTSSDKQSTRRSPLRCIIGAGLTNRIKYNVYPWTTKVYHVDSKSEYKRSCF
jgi:hypothetical protein